MLKLLLQRSVDGIPHILKDEIEHKQNFFKIMFLMLIFAYAFAVLEIGKLNQTPYFFCYEDLRGWGFSGRILN